MACSVNSLYSGQVHFSDCPPRLILICGPCRAGTTALSNVFAKAGIESHMQPIKSARRAKESGQECAIWEIGVKKEEFALSKETFGPRWQTEFFNPLEILLNLGYPEKKIVVIPIIRDPKQMIASWRRMWRRVELQKFAYSYEMTFKIMEKAESSGVLTIPYVHEIIKDNSPNAVIERLFKLIGLAIPQPSACVNNRRWGNFKGSENVFFYDDPPERFVDGIKERGKYEYKDLAFSKRDEKAVEAIPRLKEIYKTFYELCQGRLGF